MENDELLAGAIAAHGGERNRLVVLLSEYEGRRILDLRRWYTDAKTSAWTPTKKGVSLTYDAFTVVVRALQDNEERIRDWLSASATADGLVREGREAQVKASAAVSYARRPFDVIVESWAGPDFFRVDAKGGADTLVLNSRHPGSTPLIGDATLLATVAPYLISFSRAQRLADSAGHGPTADALALLSANWALLLRQYFGRPKP